MLRLPQKSSRRMWTVPDSTSPSRSVHSPRRSSHAPFSYARSRASRQSSSDAKSAGAMSRNRGELVMQGEISMRGSSVRWKNNRLFDTIVRYYSQQSNPKPF